jgi:hypothetical protein
VNDIDTTSVSVLAMELADQLSERYKDWENVEFGTVAIVVEVSGTPPEDERDPDAEIPANEKQEYLTTHISYRCSDPRRWLQEQFLRLAYKAAKL